MPTNRKEYSENYYRNNKARMQEQSRVNGEKKRARVKAYIQEYLLSHPCVDCGESNRKVLEFDHRNRSEKVFNISDGWGLALKRVIDEIEKCDVRCASCHRHKTFLNRDFVPIVSGWVIKHGRLINTAWVT